MTKEKFNQLDFDSQWKLFNQGVIVGKRTIINGEMCWCRQINEFYIIQTLYWGSVRKFFAYKNISVIDPFLKDVEFPDIFEQRDL